MMLDFEIFQREIMMLDFDLTFQTNNVKSDLLYVCWVMLTSTFRALVKNPVKERFYGKRKKN